MSMIALMLLAAAGDVAGGGGLDTQTVTTGALGTAPAQDRLRGFVGGVFLGSINDGTSDIYAGAAIDSFYWDENLGAPIYVLSIPGAANTGWTQVVIDGAATLSRTAASFSGGVWTWTGAPAAASQAFGASSSVHTCVFT